MSVLFPADSISGRSPVGAVQAYYGASDPEEGNWLICDGRDTTGTAIELATVYPKLYRFLGNSNVLPDLRGEFLRGTGANPVTQYSGANVGEHQDGTPMNSIVWHFEGNRQVSIRTNITSPVIPNMDKKQTGSLWNRDVGTDTGLVEATIGVVRPTNTSVNWIICAR